MSKKLSKLAANFCAVSLLTACNGFPPMPDIEVKLIDSRHDKVHVYLVPKQQGQNAIHVRSEPLMLLTLDKNFCIDTKNYSLLEQYVAAVESYAKERCK